MQRPELKKKTAATKSLEDHEWLTEEVERLWPELHLGYSRAQAVLGRLRGFATVSRGLGETRIESELMTLIQKGLRIVNRKR